MTGLLRQVIFAISENFRELTMKIKTLALAFALTVGLGAGAVNAQDTNAGVQTVANIFDSSTWKDGAGHIEPGQTMALNPAHPKTWMNIINPKTHSKIHASMTNPAQYGQFFTPKFYVDMMNPANWMAWMDPRSNKLFLDTSTYAYWLQPGAYQHLVALSHYKQLIDKDAYAKLGNEAKAGIAALTEKDGEYSLYNTTNLVKIMNPMTYAEAMIEGGKKIIE